MSIWIWCLIKHAQIWIALLIYQYTIQTCWSTATDPSSFLVNPDPFQLDFTTKTDLIMLLIWISNIDTFVFRISISAYQYRRFIMWVLTEFQCFPFVISIMFDTSKESKKFEWRKWVYEVKKISLFQIILLNQWVHSFLFET